MAKRKLKAPAALPPVPADGPPVYVARVVGDCMAPLLPDGGVVVCYRDRLPKAGGLAVIHFRSGAPPAIKRMVLSFPPRVTLPHNGKGWEGISPAIIVEALNPRQMYSIPCEELLGVHACEQLPEGATFDAETKTWGLPS